jgi:hypothetical protein|tara:strand:- start:76 stop:228 length:153 start_codon:yes stop_codon:yes gene_type:complete
MSKKKMTNSKGDTFEWEETEEMRKAVERLHQTYREISKLEEKAPDYGVGK